MVPMAIGVLPKPLELASSAERARRPPRAGRWTSPCWRRSFAKYTPHDAHFVVSFWLCPQFGQSISKLRRPHTLARASVHPGRIDLIAEPARARLELLPIPALSRG